MERIKIGVIGCGAIAQVHHMPSLFELYEMYDVRMVCDISAQTAAYVADRYGVPHYTTDYRDLLASDVDAVLHCAGGPKTEHAVAAFEAGKHLFIEKPMCSSLQEADAIVTAQKRSGKVGQVGYMKVYDPAYEYAKREVETMDNIQFIQVNHLHPDNALHIGQFHVERFDDLPRDLLAAQAEVLRAAQREAIGDVPPHVARAFGVLSGSMIHDIYGLREMVGQPTRVVNTEIWRDGRAITITFEYAKGARGVASWVDLSNLWDFHETLEVYGDDKRVLISYPTGFARGVLSAVVVQGVDERGTSYRKEPAIDWETAFKRELRHFHAVITQGVPCRTTVESACDDIALIIDIIKRYMATVTG
jgi:predicted dehydrogenase